MDVGLGTDVAGGYSARVAEAMRVAVVVACMRRGAETDAKAEVKVETNVDAEAEVEPEVVTKDLSINWIESLYLATKGGATTLRVPGFTGSFTVGSSFDAQLSTSPSFFSLNVQRSITLNCNQSSYIRKTTGSRGWCEGQARWTCLTSQRMGRRPLRLSCWRSGGAWGT